MATQSQFEAQLAERLECSKREAQEVLDDIAELVFRELKAGEPVTIRGLAKFSLRETPAKPARMGRNPATGEQMRFKAKPKGRKVRTLVNKELKKKLKAS